MSKYGVATLAGGCFWCMELPFEKIDSVKEVISGYTACIYFIPGVLNIINN